MRFVKWGLFFVLSFVVAWIVIFTFIQEPFKTRVPAIILTLRTPAIPIYIYLAGAFALGLGIGLAVAVFNYLTLLFRLRKSRHAYKELSAYTDTLKVKIGAQRARPESDATRKEAVSEAGSDREEALLDDSFEERFPGSDRAGNDATTDTTGDETNERD